LLILVVNLPSVSTIPAANLMSLSTTTVANKETISGCWHLKVNLKENVYLYFNSTTQRCQNKMIKTFLIEDFLHLPPVSTTLVVHLQLWISLQIFKKIWNGTNDISGAWGKLIHEKSWRRKSYGTVPLWVCTSFDHFLRKQKAYVLLGSSAPPPTVA
jgi:hypothetical protein